jgi:hypothetical protein
MSLNIQPIPDDYEPPQGGEFENLPDGKYQVKGIQWFSTTDEGFPCLVSQVNGMVGRLRFIQIDGENGPPMGLPLHQMPLLIKAFKGDIKNLPPIPEETDANSVGQYMQYIATCINEKETELEIEQKDNWVNDVPGMAIETPGYYIFRPIEVVSTLEEKGMEPGWFDTMYEGKVIGQAVTYLCEILSNQLGKPSPFSGCLFSIRIPYGFEVKEGELRWLSTEEGKWRKDAKRASRWYQKTVPDFFEDFNPLDIHNVVSYWIDKADLPLNHGLIGMLDSKTSKNGFRYYLMEPLGIDVAEGFEVKDSKTKTKKVEKTSSSDDALLSGDYQMHLKSQEIFAEFFKKLHGKTVISKGEFTKEGVKFAKQTLTPLREAGKIPAKKPENMTFMDVKTIIEAITEELEDDDKKLGNSFQEKLALSLIDGSVNDDIPEEEKLPF